MESPESWNALTASLAVCGLKEPNFAWAFLVLQGLVRDDPVDRDCFLRFLEEEVARGEITGPSLACRVSCALSRAGIARLPATLPDPWGKVAGTRLEAIAPWGGLNKERLESLRKYQDCVTSSEHSSGSESSSRPNRRKPWWKFWKFR